MNTDDSGHLGGLTRTLWTRSEAEVFADVAIGMGVPPDRILLESRFYARKGWSAPQDVPAEVMEAYERLVAAGYTRRMIREE